MATQEASFELVDAPGQVTIGRVDFDEPDSSGFLPSACQNASLASTVRMGVRVTVDGTVLEMGTAYPGYGCLFTYGAVDGALVYAGPLRSNRKSGVAYAIRRKSAGGGWGFYENGSQRGPLVLGPSAVTVSEVLAFAAFDDTGAPDPVLYPVTVKLRAGFAYGDVVPWPAGWWNTVTADDSVCASDVDRMTMKAVFLVNYGDCTPDGVQESVDQVDRGTETPLPGAPPPPAPYEAPVDDPTTEWAAACIACGGFHTKTVDPADGARVGDDVAGYQAAQASSGDEVPAG